MNVFYQKNKKFNILDEHIHVAKKCLSDILRNSFCWQDIVTAYSSNITDKW